jgi:cyclic pyranopterin phosphate synthase
MMHMSLSRFRMVDITSKQPLHRSAIATGEIHLKPETIRKIKMGKVEKGDPLAVGEIAAILAAKNTAQIIPLCHSIPLTSISTSANILKDSVEVTAEVKTTAGTGVEMEALAAVSVYLLTIWDMTKQYEKDKAGQYPTTVIRNIRVRMKRKEKSIERGY